MSAYITGEETETYCRFDGYLLPAIKFGHFIGPSCEKEEVVEDAMINKLPN